MAGFNFTIKKQTYDIAVRRTGEELRAGNVSEGKYFLGKALELSQELVANCTVEQIRANYVAENRKLKSLSAALERGENPFIGKATSSGMSGAKPVAPQQPTASNPSSADSQPAASARPSAATAAPSAKSAQGSADENKQYEFFRSEPPRVTLDDVAGLDDVKRQIRLNVLAPMRQPDLYSRYLDETGCRILMYGPPGCGKSFVAEAIAGELGCAYAILNAAELLDKYVGEGSKRLRRIFDEAERFDNCLIFFDELDSVFASRDSDDSKHTKDVLTTFLTCLSGFGTSGKRDTKVIIGATNRPWALDSALVRGKRFDTQVYVGLPDNEARRFLVAKAFKGKDGLLDGSDVTVDELADMFDGYSGADISAVMDKVKVRALERALSRRANSEDDNVPVTRADVAAVLADYRNSVNTDMLMMFEAFKNGDL